MKNNCSAHFIWLKSKDQKGRYVPNRSESPYLSHVDSLGRDYVVLTIEADMNEALRKLNTTFGYAGRTWKAVFSIVRGQEGAKMICFDVEDRKAPQTTRQFLRAIKRRIAIKTRKDRLKSMKYLKRDLAPHLKQIAGKVMTDREGHAFLVWAEELGRAITVFCPPVPDWLKPYVDGMHFISPWLASQALGRLVREGEGLRITVNLPTEFHKGHAVVREQDYDLILFCGKKQLLTEDNEFRLAILQELHVGEYANSDIQTVVNTHTAEFLTEDAKALVTEWRSIMNDEELIRKQVPALESNKQGKKWALAQLLEANLPLSGIPFARRRVMKFFSKKMLDMTKLRVRYRKEAVQERYLMVDITAFDSKGLFRPELAKLSGDQVWIPGVSDSLENSREAALTRRPMAHPKEHWICNTASRQVAYPADSSSPYMYIAIGILPGLLNALGGADLDDASLAHMDPRVVERIRSLAYPELQAVPEAPAMQVKTKAPAADPFEDEMGEFDEKALEQLIVTLMSPNYAAVGVGYSCNRILCDVSNTHNGVQKEFQLVYSGRNYEHIVDSQVMVAADDSFSMTKVKEEMDAFEQNMTECSQFLIDTGRVRKEHREHVRGVETDLDRAVEVIRYYKERLEAALARDQWKNLVVPKNLVIFTPSKEDREVAREIRSYFRERMDFHTPQCMEEQRVKAEREGSAFTEAYQVKSSVDAYDRAQEDVYNEFFQHPRLKTAWATIMFDAWIVDNKIDAGSCRDGILGGNETVQFTIEAWKMLDGDQPDNLLPLVDILGEREQIRQTNIAAREKSRVRVENTQPGVYTVVAGWSKQGKAAADPEVVTWRRLGEANELGHARLIDFHGVPAIEVFNDAGRIGWLAARETDRFIKENGSNTVEIRFHPKSELTLGAELV